MCFMFDESRPANNETLAEWFKEDGPNDWQGLEQTSRGASQLQVAPYNTYERTTPAKCL